MGAHAGQVVSAGKKRSLRIEPARGAERKRLGLAAITFVECDLSSREVYNRRVNTLLLG